MQKLAIIIASLVTSLISAQGQFEKGMTKADELLESGQYDQAVQLYERISSAETDNWLPAYHAARIQVVTSFNIKDKNELTARLEKAQQYIDKGTKISPDNPEFIVIQALLYTAWVAYDGATYGMMFSGKISSLYNEAKEISPGNPRVLLSKAEWDMGSARFFGKDIKPFCQDVEKARNLFANFKAESEFHPNWGEERANQILANCE
ncbi:MAG: tetratricopeptide repeat protein [Bacteroidia bacterium]|nr:tetratricopeptide repeat protein [Bacteroidia bacterium]NNF81533.1 tetratricopeptide repeat protein [Flavobacteriaceae bacterium]NNL81194.1 tetratricopeptide repeat protein [Flavobacteriaceae bacterium]